MQYVLVLIGVFGMFVGGYLAEPAVRNLMNRRAAVEEAPEPVSSGEAAKPPASTEENGAVEHVDLADDAVAEPIVEDGLQEQQPSAPEREGTDEPAASTLNEGHPIRQIMEQSLLAGEVSHFNVAQILAFKESGQVERDGVSYDFGILEYRDHTIFGERNQDAQALIRDGKVEKWIWPSNGMRIP